jgi:hypothetical protein
MKISRKVQAAFVAALLTSAPAYGQKAKNVPPPEPTEAPDWAVMREQGEGKLKNTLFDPGSAQVQYSSGFQWGFLKPLIGRRTHGWIACGSVNAKNRLGGYVGAQGFFIFVDGTTRAISVDMTVNWVSTCDTGPAAPLQDALKSTPVLATPTTPAPSIADELAKLADLRDRGIITQAEFEAQKTKLLSRP